MNINSKNVCTLGVNSTQGQSQGVCVCGGGGGGVANDNVLETAHYEREALYKGPLRQVPGPQSSRGLDALLNHLILFWKHYNAQRDISPPPPPPKKKKKKKKKNPPTSIKIRGDEPVAPPPGTTTDIMWFGLVVRKSARN